MGEPPRGFSATGRLSGEHRVSREARLALATATVAAVAVAVLIVRGEMVKGEIASEAERFAGPLAAICQVDEPTARSVGTDCDRAEQVAREGIDAVAGPAGRGVLGTEITLSGRLLVRYSDGSVADVGQVVGRDGAVGPGGRGVAGTTLVAGRLVVAFTDGATADLGPVVGPAGVGIVSLDGTSGRLLVSLTDGSVIDAGPLPAGPMGPPGTPAPVVQSVTRTYADGSVERCTRSGGTDVDPTFTCERTAPPSAEESPAEGEPGELILPLPGG